MYVCKCECMNGLSVSVYLSEDAVGQNCEHVAVGIIGVKVSVGIIVDTDIIISSR